MTDNKKAAPGAANTESGKGNSFNSSVSESPGNVKSRAGGTLDAYRIKVIRRAMELAKDKDAEAHRLADGMEVSVEDILAAAAGNLEAAPPLPVDSSIKKRHGNFSLWTQDQERQLKELSAQGKGPTEIARILGFDMRRVQNKLARIKQEAKAQAQPAGDSPAALVSESNESSVPGIRGPEHAQEPESRGEPDAAPREEPCPTADPDPPEINFPVDLGESPEYQALCAKLAEPEALGIDLVKECVDQRDHFILAYSAVPGRFQADEAAGWATFSFSSGGCRYTYSLKREAVPCPANT